MADLSEHDIQRIAEAITKKMQHAGHHIGHDQASNIAAAAARTAVQEMNAKGMAMLGIDPANAKHIEALKLNLAFMQRLRMRSESIGQSISNAVANAVALGIIALLLLGFLVWTRAGGASLHSPPHP